MAAWLPGYNKRYSISVDNTKVDDDLADYPLHIAISSSSGITGTDLTEITDDLGTSVNRKKIAVTLSDMLTQCYVEIDYEDISNGLLFLHAVIPTVLASSASTLYFYWDSTKTVTDNTFVGDTGDVAAQNVWTSSFDVVTHHTQDVLLVGLKDSTSNSRVWDIPAGVPTLVSGGVGLAHDINAVSYFRSITTPSAQNSITIEGFVNTGTVGLDFQCIAAQMGTAGSPQQQYGLYIALDEVNFQFYTGSTFKQHTTVGVNLLINTWYYIAAVFDSVGNTVKIYVDSVEVYSASENSTPGGYDTNLYIGHDSGAELFDGIISEIRMSPGTARSGAWIKATSHTLGDTLVTYSSLEYSPGATFGDYIYPNVSTGYFNFLGDIPRNTIHSGGGGDTWHLGIPSLQYQETSWHILNDVEQAIAWHILNESEQDTAWHLLNDAAQAIAWHIVNESIQGTSWNILPAVEGYVQRFALSCLIHTYEVTKIYKSCEATPTQDFELKPIVSTFNIQEELQTTFHLIAPVGLNSLTADVQET